MNNNNLNIITYNIEKLSDTSKSIDFQQHIDDNINIIGLTEYDITQNPSTSKQILDTFKSQSFFPIASTQNSRLTIKETGKRKKTIKTFSSKYYTQRQTPFPSKFLKQPNIIKSIFEPTPIWNNNIEASFLYYVETIRQRFRTINRFWNQIPSLQLSSSEQFDSLNTYHSGNTLSNNLTLRPIALTNTIFRLTNFILTNRAMPIMNRIISQQQQAFLPSRNIHLNVQVAKITTHHIQNQPSSTPQHLLLVDMAKAFDTLSHQYLQKILEH
ncbi:hypothetical protein C6P40_004087, partial [Pichia californica]